MKIDIAQNVHLTYCTNVHPGEEWEQIRTNLEQYIPALKARLSPQKAFGIGLRLGDRAARTLLEGDHLAQFQTWLTANDLYVFTLNGFPYGGFHHQVVKDQVYAPDWSERSRLAYTIRLAKILAALLPPGMDGSISTLPLSYKPWWAETQPHYILTESSFNLALIAAELVNIRAETGKLLHIDLEPEPDGLLENAAEVIHFFQDWLLPIGGRYLAERQGIERASAQAMLQEHIQVCYDTCHFAVEYEDPASVFERFSAVGIKIGKIQLSAAIQVSLTAPRKQIVERLRPFAESTYLHQVIERWSDGTLHRHRDLADALPHLEQSPAQEWRTHFHVPIFIHDYQILQSTQDDLATVLNLLPDNPICKHLEIETYTWDVLPPQLKIDLLASIEREYQWVLSHWDSKEQGNVPVPNVIANLKS